MFRYSNPGNPCQVHKCTLPSWFSQDVEIEDKDNEDGIDQHSAENHTITKVMLA
jgi:hypothetical protein